MTRRVLCYFPQNPCPPRTGAHQRCLQMLRGMVSLGCDVTLVSCQSHAGWAWTGESCQALKKMGVGEVYVYDKPGIAGRIGNRLERLVGRGPSERPVVESGFSCPGAFRRWFRRIVEKTGTDVLFITYVWFDRLVDHAAWRGLVRVMDTLDICSLNQQLWREVTRLINEFKTGDRRNDLFDEQLASRDTWVPDPAELAVYDQYSSVIAVSPREEELLRSHLGQARVCWVPITARGTVASNDYSGSALCTVGQNPFNLQGLLYFSHRVLPQVRTRAPDFELEVSGAFGDEMLANDRIRHLGFVPDLDDAYRRAAMFVCPVFTGTGQQVKIVEAMANGLPVVALRSAAAASPLQHGENGLVARDAAEFADHVVRLWRDSNLRRRLGAAARDSAREWAERFDCSRLLPSVLSPTTP